MKYLNSLILAIPLLFGIVNTDLSEVKNLNKHKGLYYDNFTYTNNVEFNGSEGLDIDYNASLNQVGEYYEIIFDIINDSSVDVKISGCTVNDDDNYIDYELSYDDGKKIKTGDVLKKGQSKKIKYRVLYKNMIEGTYQFDSSFSIGYEQVL